MRGAPGLPDCLFADCLFADCLFGFHIVVCRSKRTFEGGLLYLVMIDKDHAHAAPAALHRLEDLRQLSDEGLLLIDGEFEGAKYSIRRGERSEDAVVEAEVGWPIWAPSLA